MQKEILGRIAIREQSLVIFLERAEGDGLLYCIS